MAKTTTRRLPLEEWHKLDGLPLTTMGRPDPDRCIVIVAENEDERIVGTWVLVFAPFLEGLWVDPNYRNTSFTAWRLVQAMKDFLYSWKIPHTYTVVQSDYVKDLAERVGFEALDAQLLRLTLPVDI